MPICRNARGLPEWLLYIFLFSEALVCDGKVHERYDRKIQETDPCTEEHRPLHLERQGDPPGGTHPWGRDLPGFGIF